jgi:hypothetical protein
LAGNAGAVPEPRDGLRAYTAEEIETSKAAHTGGFFVSLGKNIMHQAVFSLFSELTALN